MMTEKKQQKIGHNNPSKETLSKNPTEKNFIV